MGSALGTIQLILYFIYRDKKKGASKKPTTEEESMEMGAAKPQLEEKQSSANGVEGQV